MATYTRLALREKMGFYSVIQFRPNPLRAEGTNVGIVVVDQARGVSVRFAETTDRIRRMFPEVRLDEKRVRRAMEALAVRLSQLEPTEDALRNFGRMESSQLTVLPPLRTRDDDLEVLTAKLYEHAVASHVPVPLVICPACAYAFDPVAFVRGGVRSAPPREAANIFGVEALAPLTQAATERFDIWAQERVGALSPIPGVAHYEFLATAPEEDYTANPWAAALSSLTVEYVGHVDPSTFGPLPEGGGVHTFMTTSAFSDVRFRANPLDAPALLPQLPAGASTRRAS